ncbi:polysaccharide pyruvyl transferase family protein [Caballeronia sp. LZ062]|uniref:polysaccharide pyruvyl transferase family protein n=1 Tax=unclassified Caballeronia TaxID=2646786 RepID=UPI00285B46A9|nr:MULTISPECIES: polysaccharide pyruvyl transferase family protein [unclassified Caballeronia]MDR5856370.1 polysaccharide pyruvyl transferase family protein [Caballeronia sp. LZ050]MDR5873040.1 polysaccharide pyruvyl transferase family protein [Caballeronia sp. LZ062]
MPDTNVIIFGAFDRHNFGDMLFAHVAERLLAERRPDAKPVFAGLAARDMRAYGGHDVADLAALAGRWRDKPVTLVHAGGELLTCDAWDAAVMLGDPEDAQTRIARYGTRTDDRSAYARAMLHSDARAPYVVGRETFAQASSIRFNAVGGASLDTCDAALRAEVLTKLRTADDVSVRDARTQATLRAACIAARLLPDPVTMIAELFDARIRSRADDGAAADVRRAFPRGYLAVQFSADFGDDATLDRLASELDALAEASGFGIALFRAGAAPWHDDIDAYVRLAARMTQRPAIFRSLDVWDICALITTSAGYVGSSLHGRIVAMAYALPRINMLHPDEAARTGKQAAYARTWEEADAPHAVAIEDIEAGMKDALRVDRDVLRRRSVELAALYHAGAAPGD